MFTPAIQTLTDTLAVSLHYHAAKGNNPERITIRIDGTPEQTCRATLFNPTAGEIAIVQGAKDHGTIVPALDYLQESRSSDERLTAVLVRAVETILSVG